MRSNASIATATATATAAATAAGLNNLVLIKSLKNRLVPVIISINLLKLIYFKIFSS